MDGFFASVSLLFMLLNPFALSVYLIDMLHERNVGMVTAIVVRASLISGAVFAVFAWGGEQIFSDFLQVHFASFQVFGGVIFLLFAVRYILAGGGALADFRGEPGHVAGTVAMPFMIGPATVSAAILTGIRLTKPMAILAIVVALALTVVILVVLKVILDHVRKRNTALVERYVDITGRVTAIIVGTIATEMIFKGLQTWVGLFPGGGASA